ncbi:facilitated trehalose transporter Tret1-like [Centruroides sculpturatus]|uniref:facilitated trehalose transporter Tret1-like n=1 Tax=Centruroides sculpturatus TaxID=218467 RepID=UPI000C6EC754|nr:facilitated trehalose transporter Tret1-like [Centruroides sculpturatus]
MMEEENLYIPETPTKRGHVYFVAAAACCGSVSMGTALAYSSPAIPQLEKATFENEFHISSSIASWFGSTVAIGAMFSALITGSLAERLGRKTVLIFSSAPFVLGWLCIIFANSVPLLLLGRILNGFAIGIISLTVPVYIAETSPPTLRGLLGSCIQLSVTIGMLFVYFVGIYTNWKLLAAISAIFPALFLILMCIVPETPRWLLANHRYSEAIQATKFINGSRVNAEQECHIIEMKIREQSSEKASIRELFQPHILKLFLFSLGLMFFQQFNGINSFLFYTQGIFKTAQVKIDPDYCTTIVGVMLVISTFIASILMDYAGRKILLYISGSIMCISVVSLATYYYIMHKKGYFEYSWITLVCLCVFVCAFSLGFGPVPWLMMGELLPLRVKGIASSISTMFNWTCVFIVTGEYHTMLDSMHDYGTYWFYGVFCFLSCIFVIFLPETKGKTLESIERTFLLSEDLSEGIN